MHSKSRFFEMQIDSLITSNHTSDLSAFNVSKDSNPRNLALVSEFQVNINTSNDQISPAVANFWKSGNFITWEDYRFSLTDSNIWAQMFCSNGTRLGSEFQVNTVTTNNQTNPAVATFFINDNFIITWEDYRSGTYADIWAQMFYANGTRIGAEFQVNTNTTNIQANPAVATFSTNGNFIITWQDSRSSGTNATDIWAQSWISCSNPCATCSDSGFCLTCLIGYYLNPDNTCHLTCPIQGFFQNSQTATCDTCLDGCLVCNNNQSCAVCSTPLFLNPDYTCQASCPPEDYLMNVATWTCEKCPLTCSSCVNNTCLCSQGFYHQNSSCSSKCLNLILLCKLVRS